MKYFCPKLTLTGIETYIDWDLNPGQLPVMYCTKYCIELGMNCKNYYYNYYYYELLSTWISSNSAKLAPQHSVAIVTFMYKLIV